MFPNPFSAEAVGILDTAPLCEEIIWGYVVNVEIRSAVAETKKQPKGNQYAEGGGGGGQETFQADSPK